jgi:hypothetical protein
MKKQTAKFALFLVLTTLLAATLACKQSGDIVTPAEATQRALPTVTATAFVSADSIDAGTSVYLAGKGYLINLLDAPGSLRMIAGQERGTEVTIIQSTTLEGEIWYLVSAPTGEGWVHADNVSTEMP